MTEVEVSQIGIRESEEEESGRGAYDETLNTARTERHDYEKRTLFEVEKREG